MSVFTELKDTHLSKCHDLLPNFVQNVKIQHSTRFLKESLNHSWKGELRVMGLVKLFQHTMTRYVDIRCMHVDVDWIHRMPHRNGLKP